MESSLSNGFTASFRSIDDEQRHKDNEKALSKGNHISATKKNRNTAKKISQGSPVWLPFPI